MVSACNIQRQWVPFGQARKTLNKKTRVATTERLYSNPPKKYTMQLVIQPWFFPQENCFSAKIGNIPRAWLVKDSLDSAPKTTMSRKNSGWWNMIFTIFFGKTYSSPATPPAFGYLHFRSKNIATLKIHPSKQTMWLLFSGRHWNQTATCASNHLIVSLPKDVVIPSFGGWILGWISKTFFWRKVSGTVQPLLPFLKEIICVKSYWEATT